MFSKLRNWWHNHATKILGSATAFMGSVQGAIAGGWLEAEKWERQVVAIIVLILGAGTVKRGFTNSQNLNE